MGQSEIDFLGALCRAQESPVTGTPTAPSPLAQPVRTFYTGKECSSFPSKSKKPCSRPQLVRDISTVLTGANVQYIIYSIYTVQYPYSILYICFHQMYSICTVHILCLYGDTVHLTWSPPQRPHPAHRPPPPHRRTAAAALQVRRRY